MRFLCVVLLGLVTFASWGFGFDEPAATTDADPGASAGLGNIGGSGLGVKVGGALSFGALQFFDATQDWSKNQTIGSADGRLNFDASGDKVDLGLHLRLSQEILSKNPGGILDEAYIRLYLDGVDIEGGLLKRSWGRADSLSVLDIVNPLNLSDLTVSKTLDQKMAQPMLRVSFSLSDMTRLEALYLPYFEPNKVAWEGPWMPAQIATMKKTGYDMLYWGADPSLNGGKGNGLYGSYYGSAVASAYAAIGGNDLTDMATAAAAVNTQLSAIKDQASREANNRLASILDYPDTKTLGYSQAGGRLTTTLGSVDLGGQYFFGYLPLPVVSLNPTAVIANNYKAKVAYNRYHNVGLDTAFVVAGFNTRLEIGANITEDALGDKPDVYNPTLLWAAGFDRDLFAGINLNVQARSSIRLFNDKTGGTYDIEKDKKLTQTTMAVRLSQKLFKDTFEWEMAGLVGFEQEDFALAPALKFSIGDARLELNGRIFGGKDSGDMGQFWRQSYGQVLIGYSF